MQTATPQQKQSSLEYSALLSGLSMVGDLIEEATITHVREMHKQQNRFASFVALPVKEQAR